MLFILATHLSKCWEQAARVWCTWSSVAVYMWNEPGVGECTEVVISNFHINVLGFPKGTSSPRETADVFGCVIPCLVLSDLGVFPFTGPKLESISKLLVALKCPHYKFLVGKSDGNSSLGKIFATCQVRICSLSFTIVYVINLQHFKMILSLRS